MEMIMPWPCIRADLQINTLLSVLDNGTHTLTMINTVKMIMMIVMIMMMVIVMIMMMVILIIMMMVIVMIMMMVIVMIMMIMIVMVMIMPLDPAYSCIRPDLQINTTLPAGAHTHMPHLLRPGVLHKSVVKVCHKVRTCSAHAD